MNLNNWEIMKCYAQTYMQAFGAFQKKFDIRSSIPSQEQNKYVCLKFGVISEYLNGNCS
jgi:hypothetical protein